MTQTHLTPLTRENWQQCANLHVAENQTHFIPSNLSSIAAAQFYPDAVPLVIHNAAGQMIGFIMYGLEESTHRWKIFRLMITPEHQNRGHGKNALQQIIAKLRSQPGCHEIFISHHPANEPARKLYTATGFTEYESTPTKITARLVFESTTVPQP